MIKPLGWTNETLTTIKKLLANANCVSIENGDITCKMMTTSFGLLFYLKKGRKRTDEWPVYLRITVDGIKLAWVFHPSNLHACEFVYPLGSGIDGVVQY